MENPPAVNYPSFADEVKAQNEYADFGSRIVAYLIDGLLISFIFGFILIALIFVGAVSTTSLFSNDLEDNPVAIFAILGAVFTFISLALVGTWLYNAILNSSEKQGTLGKQAMNIKVTDLQGNKISFSRATGRYFSTLITGMIPFFIGYLLALFTDKKQTLHDMIASTIVLKK
ncbi:RDD family protein [compost metagenome]